MTEVKKIDVKSITDKQKLTIRNGINTYLFIMEHQECDNDDFREVYYDFYLKARSSVFAKSKTNRETKRKERNKNWDIYFDLLKNARGRKGELIKIVNTLYEELSSHSFEFSFATKLLHTKNDMLPIYDSKVRKYIEKIYSKKFLSAEGKNNIDKIEHDWEMLNKWYDEFLECDEKEVLIDWFDTEFPEGKKISDLKKIDFMIFAWVD